MSRIRSRNTETESIPERVLRRGAVKRQHLARWAVGDEQVQPHSIGARHLGPQAVQEHNVNPSLIPRETVTFHHSGPLTVSEADPMPVRRGGKPMVVVNAKVAPTADVVLDLYHNGVVFDTITLAAAATQYAEVYTRTFAPLDTCAVEVTDAGADCEGLVVVWWFE